MNKPPVLSDEEIDAAWPSQSGLEPPWETEDLEMEIIRCCRAVAQAQRDADWEHEQETVRGIFEEIEGLAVIAPFHKGQPDIMYFQLSTDEWQSIKARFIPQYCPDCNGEIAVKLEDCPRNVVGYVDL